MVPLGSWPRSVLFLLCFVSTSLAMGIAIGFLHFVLVVFLSSIMKPGVLLSQVIETMHIACVHALA